MLKRAGILVLAAAAAAALVFVAIDSTGGSDSQRSRAAVVAPPTTTVRALQPAVNRAARTVPPRPEAEQPIAPEPEAEHATSTRRPPRPRIIQRRIRYGPKRRAEMRGYAIRHYGLPSWRLRQPRVIVEHYTAVPTFASTFNTFAADVPDIELHELPGLCSHYVIDRDGSIYQLVSTRIMCRHTVGLNYTAIGIEHVGLSDAQVLGDRAQLRASLKLTRWLRCRYGIALRDIIGHNESLSSPYHRERVARLRGQTHGDMARPAMNVYRGKLRRLGCSKRAGG